MNHPHHPASTHGCLPRCPGCRDPSEDEPERAEADGAVVVVLEASAAWPSSFEAHRDGHADVVLIAQQRAEGLEHLLRRVRARVAELRLSGRCARTAVLVARQDPEPRTAVARALLARALLASLCSRCGALWLVAETVDPRLHRHMEALAAALCDGSYGPPIDVRLDDPIAAGRTPPARGAS